jgi:alanine racemase
MRPTVAIIKLADLKYNYLNIRRKAKGCMVMAVVKADAYGHGVREVCNSLNLLPQKPEYFGVATADEGAELRKNGIKQPILVFEPVTAGEAETVIKKGLIATVSDESHLNILRKANPHDKPVTVHVKINTGMNRLGVHFSKALNFIIKLNSFKSFRIDGVYTHFATSDEKDKAFAYLQLERFRSIINELKTNKIKFGLAHCANSGAILDMPESYFDMVRPGISLYGYYPSLETSESVKLKPVMSLTSVINSLNLVEEGEGVSYSRRFITPEKTNIAAVPVGYADGFRRGLTNRALGIINGEFYNQVGTVTMDRIMFNLGPVTKIKRGDKIVLIGTDKNKKIDAWDWSKILNTIPYEITCGISKRVQRIYK